VRVGHILEVYLRLKDKLEWEKHTMDTEAGKSLLASNMCVHNKMTEVLKKLPTPGLQASVSNSQKKSINKNLEEVDRVLDSYLRVLQLERRSGKVFWHHVPFFHCLQQVRARRRRMYTGHPVLQGTFPVCLTGKLAEIPCVSNVRISSSLCSCPPRFGPALVSAKADTDQG
jgi:hypothetical protein